MKKKSEADLIIWRLASVRINPDSDKPELFCLILEGEKSTPLTHEDRIIFFRNPKEADLLINKYGKNMEFDEKDIKTPLFECDIADTLYLLSSEDHDDQSVIIDTVNLILDLVKATSVVPPAEYKQALYETADYFTFKNDVVSFFKENKVKKKVAIDAIIWSVGCIAIMSTIM